MKKVLLLTRPEHDHTTHYLSNWCRDNIELAEKKGFKVLDLHRERANKKEFESMIKRQNPKAVILNGHGSDDIVAGHKNEPLLIAGENEDLLNSKIVYAISCKSAKTLGSKSIKAGARSYTGYDDDFIFIFEKDKVSRPLEDETAKLFLEHSKIFVSSLIKSNPAGESYKKAREILKNNILKLLHSEVHETSLVRFLWWDLKHFVTHGDKNAKI